MTLFSCWSPGSCFYWLLFCAAMFAVRKCSVGSKFTELEVVVLKWGVVRKLRIWAMTIKFAFIFCSGSLTRLKPSHSLIWHTFGDRNCYNQSWSQQKQLTRQNERKVHGNGWVNIQKFRVSTVSLQIVPSVAHIHFICACSERCCVLVPSWKGNVNIWKSVILVSIHYFPLWRAPVGR